jgi:hypothetical protein
MNKYLSAIEQILGISLEPGNIRNYDFSPATLAGLRDFSSGYAKISPAIPGNATDTCCFMPFPEILSGDFRTYRNNGALGGHWPAFEELANILLICDRVIIHDHLEHFASSAIAGHTANQRYDGLVNWLTVLAEWKPLIEKDIICILPQGLALSGPLQSLWEEGTIQTVASEIYYAMYPGEGTIRNGYEAEELLEGLTETEDYLTTLSIPFNRGGRTVHFYNNPGSLALHESLANAIFGLLRQKAVLAGASDFLKIKPGDGCIARLRLDAVLTSPAFTAAEVCSLVSGSEEFAFARETLHKISRSLAANSTYLADPAAGFQELLDKTGVDIDKKLSGFTRPSVTGKPRKRVTVGFATALSASGPEKYLSPEFSVIRSMMNNLSVRAQLPGSTCHFYFGVTD